MNTIQLTGRLTKDLELKYSQSGKAYCRFSLAVPRPLKKDETDFINCVTFGKTAEMMKKYLAKGNRIGVTGRLQMSKYEVNGEKRVAYDVMVDNIEFLDNRKDKEDNTPVYEAEHNKQNVNKNDDEFPF